VEWWDYLIAELMEVRLLASRFEADIIKSKYYIRLLFSPSLLSVSPDYL
jgi:hypothetical protein